MAVLRLSRMGYSDRDRRRRLRSLIYFEIGIVTFLLTSNLCTEQLGRAIIDSWPKFFPPAARVGAAVFRRDVGPYFILKLEQGRSFGVFGIVRVLLPRTTLAAILFRAASTVRLRRADGIAGRSDAVRGGD